MHWCHRRRLCVDIRVCVGIRIKPTAAAAAAAKTTAAVNLFQQLLKLGPFARVRRRRVRCVTRAQSALRGGGT